jgi:hypothetical protein
MKAADIEAGRAWCIVICQTQVALLNQPVDIPGRTGVFAKHRKRPFQLPGIYDHTRVLLTHHASA